MRPHLTMLAMTAMILLSPGSGWAAGGLAVSPITINFAAATPMQSVEISNPGDQPTEVQIRAFAWTIEHGEDLLTPTRDIGFSPPMFRLEPGAKQTVRLASLRPPGQQERAYRLFVDQLPGPPQAGRLEMPVRMSLPLFTAPAQTGQQARGFGDLAWRVEFEPANRRARLVARNLGPNRVKLLNLAYTQDDRAEPISPGLAGYVLAGAERDWIFEYSGPPRSLTVRADVDGQAVTAPASAAAP